MMYRIPVSRPYLSGHEKEYLIDAFDSTWISSAGKYVSEFEKLFAEFARTEFAVGICNGTCALHLALLALNIGPGDEVIVPSLTYIATANAVRYVGAIPVFADISPDSWCIDPRCVEDHITPRTKAIIAVDLYGHPADYDKLMKISAQNGLYCIEDAAEAHGALYKGRRTGGLADIAAFSFFGNKIITCGEGGALTFNNDALHYRVMALRGQGMDPAKRYFFPMIGHNFRLQNLSSAILCGQIKNYPRILKERRRVFATYRTALEDIPGISFQPVADYAEIAPWMFCIAVEQKRYGRSRDELMRHLEDNGVETRPFFIPIHTLPPYRAFRTEALPVTEQLAERGMNLPTFPELSDDDIGSVAALIREYARR